MNDTSAHPSQAVELIGGIVPYLCLEHAGRAADFYVKAFGAREVYRLPPDESGRTMHIHLHLNGHSLMLSDAYPEHGHPARPPQAISLHLKVDDVDAWFARAVAAGAEVTMPVEPMFWGDRYGQLRDPFGVAWSLATPIA